MDRSRFEFLKRITSFFLNNPEAEAYAGVPKQTCFSLLALYFSTPGETLDPTTPNFLLRALERINLFDQKYAQNQPPPQTVKLPEELDHTTQQWQDQAMSTPLEDAASTGIFLADRIGWLSKKAWKKVSPALAPKVNPLLNKAKIKLALKSTAALKILATTKIGKKVTGVVTRIRGAVSLAKNRVTALAKNVRTKAVNFYQAGKRKITNFVARTKERAAGVVGKSRVLTKIGGVAGKGTAAIGKVVGVVGKGLKTIGKVVGKILGAITFVLAAAGLTLKLIKNVLKYGGAALLAMLGVAFSLGTGALIGALVGGLAGGIAGTVAGAILGAKVGAALGAAIGSIVPGVGTAIGAVVGGVAGGIVGAVTGFVVGAGLGIVIGGFIGYAIEHWIVNPVKAIWSGVTNFFSGVGNFFTGLWTGVGNFFVGVGNFFTGLWSGALAFGSGALTTAGGILTGIWTGAGSLVSGFLTGVGSFLSGTVTLATSVLTSAGSFLAGVTTALSSISLAPLAAIPVIGASSVVAGYTFWQGTDIVGTAFMRQPAPPSTYVGQPTPYGACSLTSDTPGSTALKELIINASQWAGIPPAVLAAIASIEGNHMFNYSNDEIIDYSRPGVQDLTNCSPNGCGARGPMQFLNNGVATDCGIYTGQVMPDVWSVYRSAVNRALPTDPRTPEICNIKDALYAAAWKIKSDSLTDAQQTCTWDQTAVNRAAEGYYGDCTISYPSLGNRTYCQYVWDYYQSRNLVQTPPASGWFFYQGDARWGLYPSGGLGCSAYISNTGCGPTSMAMVFARFGISSLARPDLMWDEFYRRDSIGCDGTTNYQSVFGSNPADLPATYGLNAQDLSANWGSVVNYINNGALVVANTTQYGGHYVVIRGVQGNTVTMNDPAVSYGDGLTCTTNGSTCTFSGGSFFTWVHFYAFWP